VTDDQKRRNIAAEIARGDSSLKSAELLLAAGQLADAVSRAYYAALHYGRALLLIHGEEPRSHGGADRLLQRDFVRTGKLDPEIGACFSRLMTFRQNADYVAEYVFTDAMASEQVQSAHRFVSAAAALLREDGWLDGGAT
jgi:uncharacterized protein (UPF0332 family)